MSSNKKRAANFVQSEKELFAQLLDKYASAIECKRSDAQTKGEKAAAWVALTQEFNANSPLMAREESSLKSLWDNMKRSARKALSNERLELFSTGGGEADKSKGPSQVDEAVLRVIGTSATGLDNGLDGDSTNMLMLPDFGDIHVLAVEQAPDIEATPVVVEDVQQAISKLHPSPAWGSFKAPMLYNPKPTSLRVGNQDDSASTSSSSSSIAPSSSSPSSSSSNSSSAFCATKKRTLAQEAEYVKSCKRRRPALDDGKQAQLVEAKIALANATKLNLDLEKERQDELFALEKTKKEFEVGNQQQLFDLEKRKREMELQLMELKVLQMRKEMKLD